MIEVHPVIGGPTDGGLGAHFRIENGKMYRDYGHPQGHSTWSCCHLSEDKFYKGMEDYDNLFTATWPNPIFIIVDGLLYTGVGHPDGSYKRYYELKDIPRGEQQKLQNNLPKNSGGSSSYSHSTSDLFPWHYKAIAVVSAVTTLFLAHNRMIPGLLTPFPKPAYYHVGSSEFVWNWLCLISCFMVIGVALLGVYKFFKSH